LTALFDHVRPRVGFAEETALALSYIDTVEMKIGRMPRSRFFFAPAGPLDSLK